MNGSIPGFWVHHQLLVLAQNCVYWFWWCHPNISSSVIPFSFCHQYFAPSGSFPMSQYFSSGGQSTGASGLASVFSMNIQDWFPLGLTGLISLLSNGVSRIFSKYSSKVSILQSSTFFMVQLSYPYMTTGKIIALTIQTFVCKLASLLFKTLSRFVIAFLPRSKSLWISWLQSQYAVILELKKIKSVTVPLFFHIFAMKWWDQMPWS